MIPISLILHITSIWVQVLIVSGDNVKSSDRSVGQEANNHKPEAEDPFREDVLLNWLLTGRWNESGQSLSKMMSENKTETEYPGYDGWYNNIGRPDLGAVDTPLLRRVPAAYADGVYQPSGSNRPQPLQLSEKLLSGEGRTKSKTGKNALLVFFGQQVVEEILDAQRAACPPEYFNVNIHEGHEYRKSKHTEMPVLRTRYDMRTGFSPNNPRQQLNEITPYIDGGLIYGTTKAWSDILRTDSKGRVDPHGRLATSDNRGQFPEINTDRLPMANPPPPAHHSLYIRQHETARVDRFFKLGNPRGNENPFLLTFGIIWFRWHNVIAERIYQLKKDDGWSSDRIFNEARKWVIATQQHIITNDWLPQWLNEKLPAYEGYDPSIDPQIDQFFQSAAFRFGHTLVPSAVNTLNRVDDQHLCNDSQDNRTLNRIRTCNSFWRPQEMIKAIDSNYVELNKNLEKLIMGMSTQLCEKEDHKIVEDLRGKVFGPLEFSRRDLMALNIQRARDHGLPDYNTAREAYGLPRVENSSYFVQVDEKIRAEFDKLYGSTMDDVDIWVGGIMETDTGPGPLFKAIIIDQFKRIRGGDRFWYNNTKNGLFTEEEIQRIEKLTFYDILLAVTTFATYDIPRNPFRVPDIEKDKQLANYLKSCYAGKRGYESFTYDDRTTYCHVLQRQAENCTELGTYDYFSASELPYIATFVALGVLIFGFLASSIVTLNKRSRHCENRIRYKNKRFLEEMDVKDSAKAHQVDEWISRTSRPRQIYAVLNITKKQLQIRSFGGQLLRAIDFSRTKDISIRVSMDNFCVLVRVRNNYDLVLKFKSEYSRARFLNDLEEFATKLELEKNEAYNLTTKNILNTASTYKDRKKELEIFFRAAFGKLRNTNLRNDETIRSHANATNETLNIELTIVEFAEALSMPTDAEFVQKMFTLMDHDKNGFVSFREFLSMLVILVTGDVDEKIGFMFDMYDINRTGKITREDFRNMIRSCAETVNGDFEDSGMDIVINDIMKKTGLADRNEMSLEDFKRVLKDKENKINYEELAFNIPHVPKVTTRFRRTRSRARIAHESVYGETEIQDSDDKGATLARGQTTVEKNGDGIGYRRPELTEPRVNPRNWYWNNAKRYFDNKQLQIFWGLLYTFALIAIFAERAYYFQVEREHSGLRRIAGAGVTLTRGAASAMMFSYSVLLLTMCRNILTALGETVLQCYVPFDSMITLHKYIACSAFVFTVVHVIGHSLNFYHIATQTSDDLTCLFPNYFHSTHEIPKFSYWSWQTITGLTGIALTILTATIFLFSVRPIRAKLYNWFWFAHSLYPVFYALFILHGAGRMIQPPIFHNFFLGPVVIFTLDKIVTATKKTIELPLMTPMILPSGVIRLEFPKPTNFQYKSGQWVRMACSRINGEYHPFTLSSAPHEPTLTTHVRVVGPWTSNLWDQLEFQPDRLTIHIDGPYGEATDAWKKYDVAIMVGGGIGVTPFASILKDIVFKSNNNRNMVCKKVHFLWVTRTQRQLEWMVDILREIQITDVHRIVTSYIFITEFYDKYDLRTMLLYVCERYFRRVKNQSLFTGLTAETRFGRPNFIDCFDILRMSHKKTNRFGVFSCGGRSIVNAVDQACQRLNGRNDELLFKHHYQTL